MTRRRLVAMFAVAGAAASVGALFWAWPVQPRSGTPPPESKAKPPPEPREDPRKKLRQQYEQEAEGMRLQDLQREYSGPLGEQEARRRYIVALHSKDTMLRMAVLRAIRDAGRGDVLPGRAFMDQLLELVDRRDGLERAYLLHALTRTIWDVSSREPDKERRVSSQIVVALGRYIPTLTTDQIREARLHYVFQSNFDFRLLTPQEIEPYFASLLALMGADHFGVASQATYGASMMASLVPGGLEALVKRAAELWERTDLKEVARFRRVVVYHHLHRTGSDAPRPLMERAALSEDPALQSYAFSWLRDRADRAAGPGKGRRVVYDWIVKRLTSDDKKVRRAMLAYVAKWWGIVEANWLDASTIVLHLEPDEIELLRSLRPRPILLQTILEINKPPARKP